MEIKRRIMKIFVQGACLLLAAIACVACSGNKIEGQWVEPVPGMPSQVQGVSLREGGVASSINMATLQYDRWKQQGDTLILSGKSIGNGMTISFVDTLLIDELTDERLTLRSGDWVVAYKRQ